MTKLTPLQEKVLSQFAKSPVCEKFYWTGGTLLSYHYLHHRNSLDLDFFTDQKFTFDEINEFINSLGLNNPKSQKIYDRWEFIIDDNLRLDFVLYNHDKKTLHPREKLMGIFIDSLDDIAANKTLAFFDRNEPKDLFDLYFLMKKAKYTPLKLLNLVEKKFGAKLSESSFWSESFKIFPALNDIQPLMFEKSTQEKEKLLNNIVEFFKSRSSKFLSQYLI